MGKPSLNAAQDNAILTDENRNGIRRLTLNNPARRNSLSEGMMAALQSALDDAADDPQTRVIVIGHNGPAFSAGHDLRELDAGRKAPDAGRAYFTDIMRRCATLMQTVVNHPRPVIADIRGIATAAGCQLVASCDLVIASEQSRFATPGVNIGLFCSTPMVALSRKVGQNHAMEMLLTGEFIDATRAAEIGLVTRVVAEQEQDEAVNALAQTIASKSLMTLKTGKQAFYVQADMPLAEAYDYTADVMISNMLKYDAREGVQAFLEKRQPEWRDE
ncbi:MAG: enoyl-CoA hydratase [Rhizobiaceae bacterium]